MLCGILSPIFFVITPKPTLILEWLYQLESHLGFNILFEIMFKMIFDYINTLALTILTLEVFTSLKWLLKHCYCLWQRMNEGRGRQNNLRVKIKAVSQETDFRSGKNISRICLEARLKSRINLLQQEVKLGHFTAEDLDVVLKKNLK